MQHSDMTQESPIKISQVMLSSNIKESSQKIHSNRMKSNNIERRGITINNSKKSTRNKQLK